MKKVSLLILVSMILLLAFTSCDMLPAGLKDTIDGILGKHEHVWMDATCESPKTCECGETEGEALGHNWSDATCDIAKTCTVCGNTDGEALGHTWVDATCETPKTCSVCKKTEGAALGHKWTAASCDAAKACSVCGKTDGSALGHSFTEYVSNNDATCTADATKTAKCDRCDETDTITVEGSALGHAYTYECDAYCANCYELTNEDAAHKIAFVEAKAPTCTAEGNIAYYTCEYCASCWLDEELKHLTNRPSTVVEKVAHEYFYTCDLVCMNCDQITNPDAKHTISHVDAKAATCTENGNIEYWTCSDCGYCWSDADLMFNLPVFRAIIPALGHTYTYACDVQCSVCYEITNPEATHTINHVEAKAPTCYEDGNYEYWTCSDCGYYWLDEELQINSNRFNVIVPAKHTSVVHMEAVEPGCHYIGHIEYWMCYDCETVWTDADLTQISNTLSVRLPALGGDVVHVEAKLDCYEGGNIEHWYCEKCEQVWQNAELTQLTNFKNVQLAPGHVDLHHFDAVAPACHYDGNVEYWHCYTCETVWTDEALTQISNVKNVIDPALGGDVVHMEAIEPGCHFQGRVEYWICYECEQVWIDEALTQLSNIKNVIVPEIGGEVIHVEAIAPSCTEMGNIEFWYCEECMQVWQNEARTQLTNMMSVKLPANGHTMADATCLAPATCTVCGHTEGARTAHNPVASIVDGQIAYACSTCDQAFVADQSLIYDGSKDLYFSKGNGSDIAIKNEDGQYNVLAGEGAAKSQYMIYAPSNDINHKDSLKNFNADNYAFGVMSFKIKMNVALKNEAVRIIVMSARNNPNWDANGSWSGNSIDILAFMPNFTGDEFNGTYRVYGNSMTSNTFATVNADEWVDVKMFMQFSPEGVLSISYYINGEFCNVYTRDCTDPEAGMAIKNLDINCGYICGYAGPGTGLSLDDFYMGYATYTEWLFDTHVHAWVDATCTDAKYCSACGLTEGEALGHNALPAVKENIDAPSCVLSGSHDEVVYCATCNAELSRDKVTDAALGHTDVAVPGHAATCTEPGLTDGTVCSVCGTTTLAQESIPATGHKDENSDLVCDNCGVDLACKHEGATETVPGHAPTCDNTGLTDGVKCLVCGDFITAPESIPATGHSASAAVAENVTAPTCTTEGKHDDVVYCATCGHELSREKNIVDAALGHDEIAHEAQAPTCTAKGWDAYVTCSRCDYNTKVEKDVIAHSFTVETCAAAKVCTVCGKTTGDVNPNAHNLVISYANGTPVYSCSICDYSFKLDTFDYNNGSNYNGLHCNAAANNTVYTTDGKNYPVIKDGYLEFVRTDAEAGAQKQLQMWLPTANGGTNKFSGFTAASQSIGYLSFKVNAKTDVNFEMKLVDHRVDKLADGTNIRWGDQWAINDPVFRVMPESNGKAELRGFNGFVIGSFDVDADGYTGWVDVAIQITLDPVTDKVIANYYVNGNYAGTQSRDLSTHTDAIQGVYINFNSKSAGCGYKIDDIVFGYTAHVHNLELSYVNNNAVLACACGATYTLESEYVEWNGDGNDSGYRNVPNGNVELSVNAAGQYEYIFKPSTDVAPDFSAAGTQSQDGWYEYTDKGYAGGQLQMWMPSNNRGEQTLTGFSCENDAVGVISFNVKSNLARHKDWDTSLTFSIGKPRNADDWSSSGGWDTSSINIFTIEEYQESGVVVKGGLNGTNLNLATIPVDGNGWSEWFNVTIVIEMTKEEYINVYYYINGKLCGSDSRDLNNPGGYRTLNPKKIEALQISGWTYAANTGIVFDDFVFGYTANGHNTLDGHVHNITETNCGEKSTCSCGWTGYTVAHTFASDCAPACQVCGLANQHPATHASLTTVIADNSVKYVCGDCGMYYAPDNYGLYYDGNDIIGKWSANNEIAIKVEDGYNRVYMTESDGTYHGALGNQHMLWVPSGSTPAEFDGFTCANNATGLLSFKIKGYSDTNNIECKINDARGTTAFDWSKTSVSIFTIAPVKDPNATTTDILGLNGQKIGTVPVGADHWTEWLDVAIVIHLTDDNMISVDYYLNGKYFANIHVAMPINTYKISTFYINGYVKDQNGGYCLDDMAFGYTTGGMHQYKAPFYTETIAKEEVASEVLQTIATNKIKQWDQSNAHNDANGTPVYVKAEKDGAVVTGAYFSKTTPWVGDEKEQFSEFRVSTDGSKLATSITFSYKIDGTVEKNDRYTFKDLAGNEFSADAYVQIKTPVKHELAGDDYPELSGTDLILDGEWHTMTYTFEQPLAIINILFNLYHFQGELIIADLEVEYAKEPFYTEVIAKEEVESEVLQTIATNKIKQWDQSNAHNDANGTPVYVKAEKDGAVVTGAYFSKTTPWVGDEKEQFSEFRVSTDGSKLATSITFSYKIDGTVEKNDRYTFKDLAGNEFSADAYVQIKTPVKHELAGDDYPELSGTDLILDGEWHTMTYTFEQPLAIINILFNLYHFQGELIIADLVVNYAE